MIIRNLFRSSKFRSPISISQDVSVRDAIIKMVNCNTGMIYVFSDDGIVGIFSKKDFIEKVLLFGLRADETCLKDIMTKEVVLTHMDMPLEECLSLMMEKKIKFIPVLDGRICCGVISISEVIAQLLSNRDFIIKQLNQYIAGSQFIVEADDVFDLSKVG
jgi:signal-transduction protein with cAMP-binding, CBS, and nucleotidyltransferase domain